MDITALQTLINTMGFPIVMVLYFIWDRRRSDDKYTATLESITQALNNNTLVIERLTAKISTKWGDFTDVKDDDTLPD